MKCFTEMRGSNHSKRIASMTKEEALETIKKKIRLIAPQSQQTNDVWEFWAEKLVFDVLGYCHRADFPTALIYTCVDLILKRMADAETAAGYSEESLLLSEIKMDDTTFKFSTDAVKTVTNPDNAGLLSDSDFDSIKPRLNLYRKPVSY